MPPVLRSYQVDIENEARRRMMAGIRSILLQSPTGSGKTLLTASMLGKAAQKGMPSLFVLHRRELIKQSILAFSQLNIRHGVIANGFPQDPSSLIQIGSVQTLSRRIGKMREPKLVVFDECHHLAAKSWSALYDGYPKAFFLGLTATPERLDGRGLEKYFRTMIHGPSVEWLIKNNFLCPYKLYAPTSASMQGVHVRMGDFVKSEAAAAIDKPTITGDAIKHYRQLASGKRAVVFCVSVEHSKHVVEQFRSAGISAAHVDGETNVHERDEAIRKFAAGEIKVLSNVELFGEGFDLPALEVAILLRPTKSLGLYLQQVGRALRTFPGKTVALILDHAGNCARHGLPDEEREWTLAGHHDEDEDKGPSESVKICPKCFAAQFPGRPACTYCGFVFEAKPREVEEKEGDLSEVDIEAMRKQRRSQQAQLKTLEELIIEGKKRGYRRPELWARHIIRVRQDKQSFKPKEI